MTHRKTERPDNQGAAPEAERKLMHDKDSKAFAEGKAAARESFKKLREILQREKRARS